LVVIFLLLPSQAQLAKLYTTDINEINTLLNILISKAGLTSSVSLPSLEAT
jgi:hypothetical protein